MKRILVPPPPRVHRSRSTLTIDTPCPTNAVSNEHLRLDRFFFNLINSGLGTESVGYRTACPTNAPVRTVFFQDFIVCRTQGWGVKTQPHIPVEDASVS